MKEIYVCTMKGIVSENIEEMDKYLSKEKKYLCSSIKRFLIQEKCYCGVELGKDTIIVYPIDEEYYECKICHRVHRYMNTLQEKLADLEHEQWIHWTKYMLDNLTPENIERWKKQCKTPYSELTEKEKDSDREWSKKVINLLSSRIWWF